MSSSRLNRSLRAIFVGLAVNTLLTAGKMAAGLLGHSHALVADAVESLADIFSSLIVWRGLVVADAPADEDHPYGHGKAEPIAAAIVATIICLASVWIASAAITAIGYPHPGPAPFTLVVLCTVVLIKEGLFRFVLREGQTVDSSAVQTDAWHHRSDAITSVAAALGISIALIGGKPYAVADDVAAIAAAVVIAWNGWRLLSAALNELMDHSPNREIIERIRQIAQATDGVEAIEKCLVRKMGYQYYVDIHVEVDPQMTVLRSHHIAHDVKDRIRTQLPSVCDVLVHIEPSNKSATPAPAPAARSQ